MEALHSDESTLPLTSAREGSCENRPCPLASYMPHVEKNVTSLHVPQYHLGVHVVLLQWWLPYIVWHLVHVCNRT